MKKLVLTAILILGLFGISYAQGAATALAAGGREVARIVRENTNDRDRGERVVSDDRVVRTSSSVRGARPNISVESNRPTQDNANSSARFDSAVERFRTTSFSYQRAVSQAQRAESLARYEQWRGSPSTSYSRAAANEAARRAWEARAQMDQARQDLNNARREYWGSVRQQNEARQAAAAEQNRAQQQRWGSYWRNYYAPLRR